MEGKNGKDLPGRTKGEAKVKTNTKQSKGQVRSDVLKWISMRWKKERKKEL